MARQHASRGGDDAVDAEEEEVGVLHHVARPGVDQEHEAAQDEVERGTGGGQADADGIQAPASGSEAGDRGGADHAVGLVLERVPGVQALERYVQVLQRRGDEEQAGGQSVMCRVFGTLRLRWATS